MYNNLSSLNFPHGATPIMEKIMKFHEKCLLVIIFVLSVVLVLLLFNYFNLNSGVKNLEKTLLEMGWTIIPTFMIMGLMIPSLEVLYFSEDTGGMIFDREVSVVGHQWYWTYSSNLKKNIFSYDSYMVPESEMNLGNFRKCEVDRPLFLNVNSSTRLFITSADVIHSWAVPEFGVKVDALPGRIKKAIIYTPEIGRFFGFCSELCGVNHSFMPMVVEVAYY